MKAATETESDLLLLKNTYSFNTTREKVSSKILTEYDKFKLVRPVNNHALDEQGMPIMNITIEQMLWIETAKPINIQNLKKFKNNTNKIVFMFRYDKYLEKYWQDPLKYHSYFDGAMVVCTPDYSVYPNMNKNAIAYNVFRNRWLGCFWQNYGSRVIPTISWAGSDTYDICFSGVQKGGIVTISTLGCQSNKEMFLEGFFEMKKRLEPSLIVVFGNMIEGLKGRFVNYKYNEAFDDEDEDSQPFLFETSPIFEL